MQHCLSFSAFVLHTHKDVCSLYFQGNIRTSISSITRPGTLRDDDAKHCFRFASDQIHDNLHHPHQPLSSTSYLPYQRALVGEGVTLYLLGACVLGGVHGRVLRRPRVCVWELKWGVFPSFPKRPRRRLGPEARQPPRSPSPPTHASPTPHPPPSCHPLAPCLCHSFLYILSPSRCCLPYTSSRSLTPSTCLLVASLPSCSTWRSPSHFSSSLPLCLLALLLIPPDCHTFPYSSFFSSSTFIHSLSLFHQFHLPPIFLSFPSYLFPFSSSLLSILLPLIPPFSIFTLLPSLVPSFLFHQR